jgi:hypothetical protein
MAWTVEDRRKYAPAIQELLRRGMLVRIRPVGAALRVDG